MKRILFFLILTETFLISGSKAQLDYNDVATIFYNRCTSCHHNNQVAYFSLLTYQSTIQYTSFIQTDLITSHMPPWFPDTAYSTHSHPAIRFLFENTITETDKNKILQWINDGTLQGNTALVPAPPVYRTGYKLNGNPSLVLQIPTFTINASLSNQYPNNCFVLPTGLTADRWLQAFEIVPGNYPAVHHVVVTLDTTGTAQSDLSGYATNKPNEIYIGACGPNTMPTIYPNQPELKTGMKIPAGSKIILRIRNASGSGGLIDSTKIRLFFYPTNDTGIRQIHSDAFLQYWGKQGIGGPDLLANTTTTISATPAVQTMPHPLPPVTDISLLEINPLSRNICTAITDYAFNNTDTIPLIHFGLWDYEWEGPYYFPNLLKIPSGYTLKTERFFDNTSNNIHQPNKPIVNVNFGTTSSNEILFDCFQWLDYQAGDELLDINSLIAKDTLLTVGINKIVAPSPMQCFIYPNPATDKINIYLSKKSEYKGRIISITGQNVLQTETFKDALTIDVINIPAGLYIIEITDIKSNERVTKKIVINN